MPAEPHLTRRVVTVLFADLVGSTSLAESLDPERWGALQQRYFAAARAAIEAHGGTVEKFIGDAVVGVFGVPLLHEDDALRAVRAAVELRTTVAAVETGLDGPGGNLVVRVGLETGLVVAGDPAAREALASGDVLATAARLEQAADPGAIILGPETLALVSDTVVIEPLPPLALRGKAVPVAAVRLASLVEADVDGRRVATPLVGRRAELIELEGALSRVTETRAAELVTIVAPGGTGKSRLVQAFLGSALARPVRVARGRCLPYGGGGTFGPIAALVRDLAGLDSDASARQVRARLRRLLATAGPDGARLVAILAALLGVGKAPLVAADWTWGLLGALRAASRSGPLVILVEDLHWADPAVLAMLEAAVDLLVESPVLVVATTRPDLFDRAAGWAADRISARRLELRPLGPADASALLDAQPGGVAIPTALRRRIEATADGNPLYLEEMVGKLVDGGELRPGPDGWTFTGDERSVIVPATVTSLIAARLDGLERAEQVTAERSAVVGRSFVRAAAAALVAPDPSIELDASLAGLNRKQIIGPDTGNGGEPHAADPAYRFHHVLIRDAAYERLTKAERAMLHARLASWLEGSGGELALIAHHLAAAAEYRADLGTLAEADGAALVEAAVRRSVEAARDASRRFAHHEAAELLARAAALRPHMVNASELPTTLALREAQAAALNEAGEPGAATEVLSAAMTAAEPLASTDAARVGELLAWCAWNAGDEELARAEVRHAIEAEPADAATRTHVAALSRAARMDLTQWQNDAAIARCEQALPLAVQVGDRALELELRITLASVRGQQQLSQGAQLLDALRPEVVAFGDPALVLRLDHNLAVRLFDTGDGDAAMDVIERAIAVAIAAGYERTWGASLLSLATSNRQWAGRFRDAIAYAGRALELHTSGWGGAGLLGTCAWAKLFLGDDEGGLRDLDTAKRLLGSHRGVFLDGVLLDEGGVDAWAGRSDDALHVLDGVRERLTDPADVLLCEAHRIRALADLDVTSRRHGEAGEAHRATLLRRSRDAARAAWATGAAGIYGEYLMPLVDGEFARGLGVGEVSAWAAAIEREAELGQRVYEAYARWRYAEALATEGVEPDRVSAAVDAARAVAEPLEAGVILRELDALVP